MEAENYKSKTLFIRNLPFVTTNEKLTTLFEDIGPIKQCFVVKKKDSDLCRGFGYVKFSLIEDAIKAKDTITKLEGRKLIVSFADHKRKKPRKFSKKDDDSEEDEDKDQEEAKETHDGGTVKKGNAESGPNHDSKYLKAKIVVLTGFGPDLDLGGVTDLVSHVKKVNKIVFPVEDRTVPTAFLKFKCVRDAKLAIRKVHDKTIKGCKLSAVHLSKEFAEMPQKMLKRCRLIIRNLSFQLGDEELRSHFEGFGELTDVTIPTKPDGKKMGFGFVQYTNMKDAEAAISAMNSVKLKGRPIAVDWALSKHTYEALKDKETAATPKMDEGSFSAESDEESAMSSESDDDSTSSEEEEEEQEDSDEESEEDSDISDSSDEGYSDESEDERKKSNLHGYGTSRMSTNLGMHMHSDKRKGNLKQRVTSVRGKTLFIRNVPFRCEEEDLQDVLSDFGNIVYCKLVMDPYTQHAKGTAFVKFDTVEEADKCLAKSKDTSRDGGITIMDRPLVISHAVSRKDADDLMDKEKKKENKVDKRNLFLVREGLIRPGTQAAEGLSKADLDKRAKIESQMRQKLKNANIFVSSTRLCIQNLPVSMEDGVLKQKILAATEVKTKHITECRIMRDVTRVTNKSKGKSRGYAFVEFSEHKHALETLKSLNNAVHGGKRLIIHFSLEDQRMLLIRQKKLEKMKARKAAVMKKDTSEEKPKVESNAEKSAKSVSVKLGQVKASARRKSEQDQVARKLWTGPKGMPTHSGAKVRHKPRQGQGQGQGQGKKEKKDHIVKGQKRPASNASEKEPAKKKKKKSRKGPKGPSSDNFDRLVQSYKSKMTAAGPQVRQKWFS
ncbi:RNA-binding protein 28-like [Haliotis rubra]|uniref:RNA-binding protein 28-like n=1 Tax=Haliotis rubra TaxID=36100 RepID=UPI001EE50D09|nr:RNA-binding protein 28-like [Haliotis rubra]